MSLIFCSVVAALIVLPPAVAYVRLQIAREVLRRAKKAEGEPLFMEINLQAEQSVRERAQVRNLLLHWACLCIIAAVLASLLF